MAFGRQQQRNHAAAFAPLLQQLVPWVVAWGGCMVVVVVLLVVANHAIASPDPYRRDSPMQIGPAEPQLNGAAAEIFHLQIDPPETK